MVTGVDLNVTKSNQFQKDFANAVSGAIGVRSNGVSVSTVEVSGDGGSVAVTYTVRTTGTTTADVVNELEDEDVAYTISRTLEDDGYDGVVLGGVISVIDLSPTMSPTPIPTSAEVVVGVIQVRILNY